MFGARGLRVEAFGSCGLKVLKFSCDWVEGWAVAGVGLRSK